MSRKPRSAGDWWIGTYEISVEHTKKKVWSAQKGQNSVTPQHARERLSIRYFSD
jgi:hypothetical protein